MQAPIVIVLVVVASCLTRVTSASTDAKWAVFKHKYSKNYSSSAEEARRRLEWEQNLQEIERHNELFATGKTTFYLGENKYSDLSSEQFRKIMLCHKMKVKSGLDANFNFSVPASLPAFVDWRREGYVTKVKDQGNCGSCYTFSTTGSLEGQHFKATGNLVSLSESNLLDCTRRYGNHGCDGGSPANAFQYIIDNGGIDTEKSYPYQPRERICQFTKKGIGATMRSFKYSTRGNEAILKTLVAKIGPVSVGINAGVSSFMSYTGSVYHDPACTSRDLNHAVLVVGYGHDSQSGLDYWIVKNSWGDSWGIRGYMLLARNRNNLCGIASQLFYPVV